MNVFLNGFSSAKSKGPGVPGSGAGESVSFLTTLMQVNLSTEITWEIRKEMKAAGYQV
jgi:hypothetical protein